IDAVFGINIDPLESQLTMGRPEKYRGYLIEDDELIGMDNIVIKKRDGLTGELLEIGRAPTRKSAKDIINDIERKNGRFPHAYVFLNAVTGTGSPSGPGNLSDRL
ncbi:unnamed protein product, partial [marine sediment metagenome]